MVVVAVGCQRQNWLAVKFEAIFGQRILDIGDEVHLLFTPNYICVVQSINFDTILTLLFRDGAGELGCC